MAMQYCKVEYLSFGFQTIPWTPGKFSQKVSRSVIFAAQDESIKTTKIMCLENLALYGNSANPLTRKVSGDTSLNPCLYRKVLKP